jgi:hypothetical protein
MFQPNKEIKVEESALQHNHTENTEHTKKYGYNSDLIFAG